MRGARWHKVTFTLNLAILKQSALENLTELK